MRATLGDLRNSRIPETLGVCSTDTTGKLTSYVNEAQEVLIKKGRWWGTYQRYDVAVRADYLVFPRQVAAIEQMWINKCPVRLRNEWFELMEGGWGPRDCCLDLETFDHGITSVFEQPQQGEQVRVYSLGSEATGLRMLVEGYDNLGIVVQTDDSGTVVDGEYIDITNSKTPSVTTWSSVSRVQKPVTKWPVVLTAWDSATGLERTIGWYDRDETTPAFRKFLVPGLSEAADANDACDQPVIRTMVKLDFVPVKNDVDYLVIANLPALKHACLAIKMGENGDEEKSLFHMSQAVRLLDEELEHYMGRGYVAPMKVEFTSFFGGEVENLGSG